MKIHISFILTVCCLASLGAQNLPSQMQLSADGRMLRTGSLPHKGLYDSAVVRSMYLNFKQADYWAQMTANYNTKVDLPATMVFEGKSYDSVGVRFKGQTSYRMNSSSKKSFNLTMDHARADQDLMGYKTLNLNNAYQDPSFMREVMYQHQIRRYIPAAQSNFVRLYLNGQDWGLYANVQQLNKDFLKEWFFSADGISWRADRPDNLNGGPGIGGGWGDGTAGLNYLGADSSDYKKYYTLKSSGIETPWERLIETTYVLNKSSSTSLKELLPKYLDIDRVLWFLACEIAFTDDDSYVYKGKMDYYLYYERETGRITPIEYDGNSSLEEPFAATWGPFYNQSKINYPLMNRILAVPEWRQRYLAHLRTIIKESLQPDVCGAMVDNYRNLIEAHVQSDPKKIYPYTQFVSNVAGLKNFFKVRYNYLLNDAEVKQTAPALSEAALFVNDGATWEKPVGDQPARVSVRVAYNLGIAEVKAYYSADLTGNFNAVNLYDDGQHHDGAAADGVYGGELPAQKAGTWVRFYFEATANTIARSVSYLPVGAEHDVYIYQVVPVLAAGPVVINEIMASNSETVADEKGDYEDWIELYNNSSQAADLSGYFLSDNPANLTKFELVAGTSIPAGGYLIYWADEDGVDGPNHCNFKLSASGETLFLLNPALQIVDSLTFGAQTTDKGYARVPNGTGKFVVQAPSFKASNNLSGTADLEAASAAFHIAPNPAGARLAIRLERLLPDARITISDMQGRVALEVQADQRSITADISGLPAGVYAVRYGLGVKKLMIVK